MIQRGITHHPLKNYYLTAGIFHHHCTPHSNERLVCKIHSATPVFWFPWEGEVHKSAFEILLKIDSRGKEQFDCASQNGFVIHSCELQVSFGMLSPSGSSKTGFALRPGSVHQRCLRKKKPNPKTVSFALMKGLRKKISLEQHVVSQAFLISHREKWYQWNSQRSIFVIFHTRKIIAESSN